MRIINTDELFRMEVINLCDGARLGCPEALEIDTECAAVTALLIPCDRGLSGFLPFGRRDVWRIPWCKIECVGEDTLLVRLNSGKMAGCCQKMRK